MNLKIKKEDVLFLDIETVPQTEFFEDLSDTKKSLFAEKTSYQRISKNTASSEIPPEEFYQKAGIWAEFGKIICISIGFFHTDGKNNRSFRIKSFYGDNEFELLKQFKELLDTRFNNPKNVLCGHNGKEFDFPYIARRMIVNRIDLPEKLNLFGKKPWEVAHLDTLEMWKFGDYKKYTSLELLADLFEISSPKEDIDGSEIARVYYKEKDIERIVRYCEKDTITVAQLFLRFNNEIPLKESETGIS